jgi:hypothetical protein
MREKWLRWATVPHNSGEIPIDHIDICLDFFNEVDRQMSNDSHRELLNQAWTLYSATISGSIVF